MRISLLKLLRLTTLLIFGSLLVAGCQTPVQQSPLIEIYKEGTTPTRPYEKIKLLYNVTWESQENDAMRYFIRKAEIMNVDALIILPRERVGLKVYPFGKIGVKYRFKALAVKWTNK